MENMSYCDLVWNTNENREKIVEFDKIISGRYITLDSLDMLWNNVTKDKGNDYFSINDGSGYSKITLEDRYYTSKELVKKLKEKDKNTLKNKVETKFPLKLRKLGKLLEFSEGTEISANSSKVGENIININDGLQTISIIIDKVNSSKNFFNGFRTQVLCTLSIPSDKRWN